MTRLAAAPRAPAAATAAVMAARFRRSIDRAMSGLALTAVFVLLSTGEVSVVVAIAMVAAALLVAVARRPAAACVEAVGQTPASLLLLAACATVAWRGRGFEALMALVAGLLLLRIAAPRRPHDLTQAIALSFFLVVGASALTESVEFALPFLAYVGMLLVAATMATAYRAFLRAHPEHAPADRHLPASPRGLRRHWAATWVVLVATCIFLFLVIPRFSAPGLWLAALRAEEQASGFDEEVKFGTITNINLNHTPAMRITRTSGPDLGHVRLRGVSLDRFDGSSWRRTTEFQRVQLVQMYDEVADQTLIGLLENFGGLPSGQWLVEIERNTSNLVFVPYVSHDFPYLDGDTQPQLKYDYASGTIAVTTVDLLPKIVYRVGWSYIGEPADYPALLAAVRVPLVERVRRVDELHGTRYGSLVAEMRELNVQMPPPLATSRRLLDLARGLAGDATSRIDVARRLERRLQSEFAYSLQSSVAEGMGVVETFLFEEQRGHCEHFATAMVMLLRRLGIPARLVNGYYSDEFNPVAGGYIVRESNAHSWVEVFFDEVGWLPFDPTPPEGRGTRKDGASLLRRWLSHLYDSARAAWYRNVIDFSIMRQRRLFGRMMSWFERDDDGRRSSLGLLRPGVGGSGASRDATASPALLGLALTALLVVGYLLLRVLRAVGRLLRGDRRARSRPRAAAGGPASAFAAMLRRETRRRLRPERDVATLTIRELLELWRAAGVDAALLTEAARQHEAWRYGGDRADTARAAAPHGRRPVAASLVREVKAALRAAPPRRPSPSA